MCVSRFCLAVLSYTAPIVFSSAIEGELQALSIGSEVISDTYSESTDDTTDASPIHADAPEASVATTEATTEGSIKVLPEPVTESPCSWNFPDDINFGSWSISYSFPHDHIFTTESVDDFHAQLQTMFGVYGPLMNTTFLDTLRYMQQNPSSDASVKVEAQFRRQVERLRSFAHTMRSGSSRMADVENAIRAFAHWAASLNVMADILESYADRLADGNPPSGKGLKVRDWRLNYFLPRDEKFSAATVEQFDSTIESLFGDLLPQYRRLVRDAMKKRVENPEGRAVAERLILDDVRQFEKISADLMNKIPFFEHREAATDACTKWASTIGRNLRKMRAEADKLI